MTTALGRGFLRGSKKRYLLGIIAFAAVIAFAFVACEGPAGPAGTNGTDGTSFVWMGTYENEAAFLVENPDPKDGWAYYNTEQGKTLIYYSLLTPPWQTLAADGANGTNGQNGTIIDISADGYWVIDGVETTIKAEGVDGVDGANAVTIGADGYWYINGENTGVKAEGIQGDKGDNGDTPYIGNNGNWWIGGVDTGEFVDGIINITRPTKTGYTQNELFSSAGLVVTVYYTDGTVATINSGYSLYWNDALLVDGNTAITAEPGTKTITVQWRNKTATFTISVADPSGPFVVANTDDWVDALGIIATGGNGTAATNKGYVIELVDNAQVNLAGSTNPTFAATNGTTALNYITVTLKGKGVLSLTSNGNLIRLAGTSQTLIIDSEDLTLKGNSSNNNSVVYLNNTSALLRFVNGTITGNTSSSYSGGVYVASGTFEMSGGSISENTASSIYGGGVHIASGAFEMSGGSISENTSSFYGGGVVSGGAFTMNSGSIIGNTSSYGGGGVYVSSGTFTMNNGSISENISTSSLYGGGGVCVNGTSSIFTMSGGKITDNIFNGTIATVKGGGIWIGADANFTKANDDTGNSGIISGNSSNTTGNVNGQQIQWNSSPRRYVNEAIGETDELSTDSTHAGYANWVSE